MRNVLLVAVGGGAGALCRYGTTLLSSRLWGIAFPWGTLLVNWAGCLLIGMCYALAEERGLLGPSGRAFFVTGFLGALTTFSTYALESVSFARPGTMPVAVANLLAHNVGGLTLVIAGIWLVRVVL